MKKGQRLVVMLISLLLSLVLVYGLYHFQMQYIRSEQMVSILVANKWLKSGHIITSSDLKIKLYPKSAVSDDMVFEHHTIIGKELIIPIGRDEPIANWKLNSYQLLPLQGEAMFQIPSIYIRSITSDIRAGDYVYLFISETGGSSERLFIDPIKVASVKTSNNVEVESLAHDELNALLISNEEAFYQHRRKATGVVEQINLNLKPEQWLTIDEYCKDGQAQLIIAFTPYYIDENNVQTNN